MARRERMAPVDTTWLRMDRPNNLMVIVGVIILRGPVNVARLERTLAARMLAYSRFRQRAVVDATSAWWCEDRSFDISHHIKHVRLPGKGGRAELQRFVAEMATMALDRRHPLWQMHIVEDYEGGAALVVRIHHAIGDGAALVGVLLSLTDQAGDAPEDDSPPPVLHAAEGEGAWLSSLLSPIGDALGWGARLPGQAARELFAVARRPDRLLDYVRDGSGVMGELGFLLVMPNDTRTRFKGVPMGEKRVAWTDPLDLKEVKLVSRILGCPLNDVLLTAVAGALGGYLRDKGEMVRGCEIRALVPVNLREAGHDRELGNHFGVVAVELPLGVEDPLLRLHQIHKRMEALKHSYEPAVTLGLLEALGYAPKPVQEAVFGILLSRATAVMTNVPGPSSPLYLAGSRIDQWVFWVPQAGDIGMGVSILSFDGHVQFGLMTDAGLVPDPDAIIRRFAPEFEKLLYFVLLGAGELGSAL